MGIQSTIKSMLEQRGYTFGRHPLSRFFRDHDFDVILDVGANRGQYASELRKKYGYTKRIVSFEPMKKAFELLQQEMGSDPAWSGRNWALGAESGEQSINIAGNSASSSLLDMLPAHSEAAPSSVYVDSETTQVRSLDEVFSEFVEPGKVTLLKVDTQGYEMEVLKGASSSLSKVTALQIELSLTPLYDGAPLFENVVAHVRGQGFLPHWFLPGLRNQASHQQLQMDGLFVREEFIQKFGSELQ